MAFELYPNQHGAGLLNRVPYQDYQKLEPTSNLYDTLGSAFRQENFIVSWAAKGFRGLGGPVPANPAFNPFEHIEPKYQRFIDRYTYANSFEDIFRINMEIDEELRDREILSRSGWRGMAASMLAGTLDPVNLIPVGGALKGLGKMSGNLSRFLSGTWRGAASAALGTTIQEGALYTTQHARTGEEVAYGIGAGALFGTVIGGAAGYFTPVEKQAFTQSIARDMAGPPPTGKIFAGGFRAEQTAIQALDQALKEGVIDEGGYRIARQVVALDPRFDRNSTLEIVDAVRFADDEALKIEGWTPEQIAAAKEKPELFPQIMGETHTRRQADATTTAIRLYRGHDADTILEEWYHRWFDRMTPEEQSLYEKYHIDSGDARPVREHFAQEGRDHFFATKQHEPAGGIRSIFQKAKDSLKALIGRIRELKNARIPNSIEDLYRRAGNEPPAHKVQEALEEVSYQIRKPHEFVPNSRGEKDYGSIPEEIGKFIGRQAGEIRLQVGDKSTFGLNHIAQGHWLQQIKKEGYSSVRDFVQDVIENYSEIRKASGTGLSLVKRNGKSKVAIIELQPSKKGDFYTIKTAYIARKNWLEKQQLLWSGTPYHRSHAITDGTPSAQFGPKQSIDTLSSGKNLVNGEDSVSYQIRQVYKTLADLPSGVDPDKVRKPDWMPDWAWKTLARPHPGLRPHTMKHLKTPARAFNSLLEGSERLWKNWAGEATPDAAETQIKREFNRYMIRHDSFFWDNYWDLQKRLTGESQNLQGTQRGKIKERVFHYRNVEKFKTEVYEALQELHGGKSITKAELSNKFEPEIKRAAQQMGELYNELGKRLAKHNLLPENLHEPIAGGYVHIPRVWKHGAVRDFRAELKTILEADMRGDDSIFTEIAEDTAKEFNADPVIDNILSSPTGYLGLRIDSTEATDIGTSHFLEARTIEIDSMKLWTEVKRKNGSTFIVNFVETDPEKIFKRYIQSVMPDIVLAERFSKNGTIDGRVAITLKPLFDAIIEESEKGIKEANAISNGKVYKEIIAERDAAIKDLKAMRDVLRGDYYPGGRPDMSYWPNRVPGLVLTLNAMQCLGGVVTSSLGDILRPLADFGMGAYSKHMSNFFKHQGTELFSEFKKEVLHRYGIAGEMATSARYGNIADAYDIGASNTRIEQAIGWAGEQMGLVTGIDWWNSKMKLMSTFIAQHEIMDIAEKLRKAVDDGKITSLNIETASKFHNPNELIDVANMGLGLQDLIDVAREVSAHGEIHDGLILARTGQWGSRELANRFESALSKEVDSLIITPAAGDKPLWFRSGLGKFVSQFKSYPMAAMRKIVLRGMQNPDGRLAVSVLGSTFMGGLIYTIKSLERGQTPEWDNPAQFLYEAFDRSGAFGYLLDANHYIEKLTHDSIGIVPTLGPLFGMEKSQRAKWQESLMDLAIGPTGDTVAGYHKLITSTLPHTLAMPFGGGPTQADINQAFKLVWYSRVSGFRSAMEWLRNQAIDKFAVQPIEGK